MHTYLTHSLSLAMMPSLAAEEHPTRFSWEFDLIDEHMAMGLIATAQRRDQFTNGIALAPLDTILHGIAGSYLFDMDEPARSRVRLEPGDTLLVVKYRGRKLTDEDHVLPPGAKLHFYRMRLEEMAFATGWEDTVTQHTIEPL